MYLDLLRCLNGIKFPLWHLVSRWWPVLKKIHFSESLSKRGQKHTNKIIFLWTVAWMQPSLQALHRDGGPGSPSWWSETLSVFWNPGMWVYQKGYCVMVLPHQSSQASILWVAKKSVEKIQVDVYSQIAHWFTQLSLKDQDLTICVYYINNISPSAP